MKQKKFVMVAMLMLIVSMFMNGCSSVQMTAKELEAKLQGLDVTIRTFDEESQVIDCVNGKSVVIERETIFDTNNSEGSNKDSSVVRVTIGKNEMTHVGSSLILAETGLYDVFNEYAKTVDITNQERGVPMINSMINSFKNITSGKAKTILIRSQNGKPLATYVGDNVSIFSIDIPKTTIFLVDGKILVVYRCDYTVYDTALLLE
ncbi:DUF5052 family protein [Hungatella hathewayi]|uniref:DUF5052 family protein n=1 Tax=Hungatella hathewayi TaxID=154046 RepID=UPI003565CF02